MIYPKEKQTTCWTECGDRFQVYVHWTCSLSTNNYARLNILLMHTAYGMHCIETIWLSCSIGVVALIICTPFVLIYLGENTIFDVDGCQIFAKKSIHFPVVHCFHFSGSNLRKMRMDKITKIVIQSGFYPGKLWETKRSIWATVSLFHIQDIFRLGRTSLDTSKAIVSLIRTGKSHSHNTWMSTFVIHYIRCNDLSRCGRITIIRINNRNNLKKKKQQRQ